MSPTNRLQNLSIISLYQTPQKKDEFHYMLVPSRLPNRTPKYEKLHTHCFMHKFGRFFKLNLRSINKNNLPTSFSGKSWPFIDVAYTNNSFHLYVF